MQVRLANLWRLILSDKNTRNLLFFLLLNLFFAFIELFYGLLTNSLGLISDSIHMFFDCSALLVGLAASVVAKWKSNEKFTFGFARAEVLAGLANGLFLLFIAFFIMKEAIERTFEPPEVHHERLFVISVLGFIVNLVGIFVFQHGGQHHHHVIGGSCSHGHGHSHNGHKHDNHNHNHHQHDHNHTNHYPVNAHSHYDQSPMIHSNTGSFSLDMNSHTTHYKSDNNNGYTTHYPDHTHDKEPLIDVAGHGHSNRKSGNRGQIMQSVFLHIVADTLGSVGVMISAVLMSQFGWLIADPICSIFIAVLISISVYPLLKDTFYVLMQRVPVELDGKLPDCIKSIQNLQGVISVHETHIWTLTNDTYIGSLKLEVSQGADYRLIMTSVKNMMSEIGVDKVNIQIDLEQIGY